jgi:hypothetical protein
MLTEMRVLQALRRSIKGDKDKPQIAIAPKSAVAIVPPKKVRSTESQPRYVLAPLSQMQLEDALGAGFFNLYDRTCY